MKEVEKEGFWKGRGEKTIEKKLINIVVNKLLPSGDNKLG